jgi:hypothetical protein
MNGWRSLLGVVLISSALSCGLAFVICWLAPGLKFR